MGHINKMLCDFNCQFIQESNDATNISFAYLKVGKKDKEVQASLVNILPDDAGSFSTEQPDTTTEKIKGYYLSGQNSIQYGGSVRCR